MIFAGAVSASMDEANVLVTLALFIFMFFDGFYINEANTPDALSWLADISINRYGLRGLAMIEFPGLVFTCTPAEAAPFNGTCPVTTGEQYLRP